MLLSFEAAPCDGKPAKWWVKPEHWRRAAALCATCPVTVECEQYGVERNATGVYGGRPLVGGAPAEFPELEMEAEDATDVDTGGSLFGVDG